MPDSLNQQNPEVLAAHVGSRKIKEGESLNGNATDTSSAVREYAANGHSAVQPQWTHSCPVVERPTYGFGNPAEIECAAQSGLIAYWRILNWRKGSILLISFAGALAGLLMTMTQPRTYQAQASVEVQDINQDFPNIRSQGIQTYSAMSDINTQIRLLQSASLVQRTREKVSAEVPPVQQIANYSGLPWRRWLHLAEPAVQVSRTTLLNAAAESIKVRVATQTRVIDISVDSVDPLLAAKFANVLANEFIDQNVEARWRMSERTNEWLGRQLETTRLKLEQSEAGLVAYAHNSGLVFTGGENRGSTNVSEDKLRQVQQSLSLASADRVAKQSRLEIARSSPPEGLPDVLSDHTLQQDQAKLTDLKREIADLTALYTGEFPKVKRLQAQLLTMESEFAVEKSAILDRIRNEYDEAVRRENLLAADYANEIHTLTGENEKSIQYTILKRDVDSNRQLFDALLQRVKESSVAAALRASNIRIVDEASPPSSPYKPRPVVNATIGLLAGFLFGVAFAVVRDRTDRSFHSPGQTPLWLNIPELGYIPSEKRRALRVPSGAAPVATLSVTKSPIGVGSNPLVECPELVTLHRKSSMMADAFRVVLPHVIYQNHPDRDIRVIVLTSASPAEGKTTVACNLAIALAEIGKKVLLVDADLRRPDLHRLFKLDNEVGLSSILRGGPPDEKSLRAAIKSTSSEGLHVLPSGPSIGNVAKTLFVQYLPELFAKLKQDFEIVLIDAPPILQLPDAPVLGRAADGVILVVRAGQTTRETAQAAHASLSVHCHVLGTILNYWDPRRSQVGYGASYPAR